MTERAAQAARSVLSARSFAAATASAVRRRGPRWPAVAASAAARGPRWPAVAASAAARGPQSPAVAVSAAARGPRWPAVAASAAARGPRWLAVAASAAARGLEPLAAADRVSGPAFPAAVVDPVAVSDPVAADAVAADCRLLVLDRSSVHVRAQRVADCHQADPAHWRRAAVLAAHFGLVE